MYNCKCGREFEKSQSLNAHFKWCIVHRGEKGINVPPNKGKVSPFKGKKLEEIVKNPEEVRQKLSNAAKQHPAHHHSEKTKKLLSLIRISILENSPHISWYEVNGIKVQGIWEKTVAEVLMKKGLTFSRPKIKYDGHRNYTPDFFINELNLYIEVKGWMSNRDKSKYEKVLADNNIDLRVIIGVTNYNLFVQDLIEVKDLPKFNALLGQLVESTGLEPV